MVVVREFSVIGRCASFELNGLSVCGIILLVAGETVVVRQLSFRVAGARLLGSLGFRFTVLTCPGPREWFETNYSLIC